jgi:hypothetical protein
VYRLYRIVLRAVDFSSRKNPTASVIRSPDRPARSQSLYRLSYPTHNGKEVLEYKTSFIQQADQKQINRYARKTNKLQAFY